MGARNTPSSLGLWKGTRARAPYRASIGNGVAWRSDRPSPGLAAAMKVSRGGRILLAFEVAGARDYFVEGHRASGAQAEPDGAEQPSPRRPGPSPDPAPRTLDEAFEAYAARMAECHAALDGAVAAFMPEVDRLVAAGACREAASILRSMPSDLVPRANAVRRLLDLGYGFEGGTLEGIDPAPLTQERGEGLAAWLRASTLAENASSRMHDLLETAVGRLEAKSDAEGLAALVERIPGGLDKAWAAGVLRRMGGEAASPRAPGP